VIDTLLRQQLARDEGRKLLAYKDTAGNWTIGVGHLLGSSPRMSSITDDECDALLGWDIDVALQALNNVFGLTNLAMLDGARWRALINMAFNRGEGRMRTSTTITPAIKAALVPNTPLSTRATLWQAVALAIRASEWATQVGDRAARIATVLETGVET
jgi:lysozyme